MPNTVTTAAPAETKPAPIIETLDDGRIAISATNGQPNGTYTASNPRAARSWLRMNGYDPELVPGSDERPEPTTPPTIVTEPVAAVPVNDDTTPPAPA